MLGGRVTRRAVGNRLRPGARKGKERSHILCRKTLPCEQSGKEYGLSDWRESCGIIEGQGWEQVRVRSVRQGREEDCMAARWRRCDHGGGAGAAGPERFSTTTACPSTAPIPGASRRATVSAAPPGAKPTIRRMGLVGKAPPLISCARAKWPPEATSAAAPTKLRLFKLSMGPSSTRRCCRPMAAFLLRRLLCSPVASSPDGDDASGGATKRVRNSYVTTLFNAPRGCAATVNYYLVRSS
jgi:hypothetical protein